MPGTSPGMTKKAAPRSLGNELLIASIDAAFHPQSHPRASHNCPQLPGSLPAGNDGYSGRLVAADAAQRVTPAPAGNGGRLMKKLAIAVALCGSLLCSPVHAKTFVGVLWPMFGPLPAIGLVELVAELRTMPDVEVQTYLHEEWPSLVEDIDRQPPGTRTLVIGYSLGANSSVFVANKAKYVDVIIALQPSMLSWNPPLTGNVGHMIEIYNPNPWMTFGGMGSKKLEGDNIEYIANNDSHPGAQFSPEFRNLAKSEITKLNAGAGLATAQAAMPRPLKPAQPDPPTTLAFAEDRPAPRQSNLAAASPRRMTQGNPIAQSKMPALPQPAAPEHVAQQPPKPPEREPTDRPTRDPNESVAFLDALSGAVNSGDLSVKRELTAADMTDYAERTYGVSSPAGNFNSKQPAAAGGDVIAAALPSNGSQ